MARAKRKRTLQGKTIAELARTTGQSKSNWSRWLRGKRKISSRQLVDAAIALATPAEELLENIEFLASKE